MIEMNALILAAALLKSTAGHSLAAPGPASPIKIEAIKIRAEVGPFPLQTATQFFKDAARVVDLGGSLLSVRSWTKDQAARYPELKFAAVNL